MQKLNILLLASLGCIGAENVDLVMQFEGTSGGYGSISNVETDNFFKESTLINQGEYDSVKKISNDNFKNSYINIPKYEYRIFEYNNVLEATSYRINNTAYHVDKDNSVDYSYTISSSKEICVENELKLTTTSSINASKSIGINFDDIFNAENTISKTLATSTLTGYSFSNRYEFKEGITYEAHLNASKEEKDYFLETRASFNVFKIYLYEINYNTVCMTKKTKYGKKYHTYEYSKCGYNLKEAVYMFSMVLNSESTGFYPYRKNNEGKFVYNGKRNPNFIYFD